MGAVSITNEDNSSTEAKIKEAAKRVFTRKGFAATRTRDIAEESGFNLALINYYFRSKEKLFEIIMQDNMQEFLLSVMGILNDQGTPFYGKIELLVTHYINMLKENPDMPLFVLHELHSNPEKFASRMGSKLNIPETVLAEQWREKVKEGNATINPIHMILNVVAMTIFPFVASPMIRIRSGMSQDQFNGLMDERKKLVPVWIKTIIDSSLGISNQAK